MMIVSIRSHGRKEDRNVKVLLLLSVAASLRGTHRGLLPTTIDTPHPMVSPKWRLGKDEPNRTRQFPCLLPKSHQSRETKVTYIVNAFLSMLFFFIDSSTASTGKRRIGTNTGDNEVA